MQGLDKNKVSAIAKLMKLHFDEGALEKFTREFMSIVEFFNKIKEVASDTELSLHGSARLRPDIPKEKDIHKLIMESVPRKHGNLIVVPRLWV